MLATFVVFSSVKCLFMSFMHFSVKVAAFLLLILFV